MRMSRKTPPVGRSCSSLSLAILLRLREYGGMLWNNTPFSGKSVCVCGLVPSLCVVWTWMDHGGGGCGCGIGIVIIISWIRVLSEILYIFLLLFLSLRLSEPEAPSVINTLFRRGTSFRYSGRTYKQIPKDRKPQPSSSDGTSKDPKRAFDIKVR